MGVASMVIGIISALLGFIPLCNYFATIPAIVGLILGIVDAVKKTNENQPKGMAVAGIILNALAIVLIIGWTVLIGAAAQA
jgi:high-affinity K+ transport system ATPase subunit B